MIKKRIANLLGKSLYRSKVIISKEDFTATHDSNCILDSLKWTLHGIHEAVIGSHNTLSITGGVYGQICEFKIINITKKSIGFFCYSTPKTEDTLFMTNNMVYIPETILKMTKASKLGIESFIK